MAANYPSSLPVKDAAGANLASNPHSSLHDDMYDEIVAIATELGTAPKGTAATVKARLDALPRGVVGYAEITTGQSGITTIADVTSLSVTWTAESARRYKISAGCSFVASSGTPAVLLSVRDGSNNFVVGRYVAGVDASLGSGAFVQVVQTGLSGSVTRKVSASSDGVAITVQAAATNPAYIVVEDIGAA